jgi:hypothetical protein
MARTDKDLYIKRFSELERGVPLYHPCLVQVGDVGFIDTHDGFFQKLYNIANPPTNGNPGCPPAIKFVTTSYTEQWAAIHVCWPAYLSCFELRTLPDFVIILAEEIKRFRRLIASNHVGQPVAVHRPIAEMQSSAPLVQVKCNLYSQKSNLVIAS